MDVSQLRTIVYVAKYGSLSKAADQLCIAQPALSRHVRLLEDELGTRLFTRHGRGMILTEQGLVILQHAQRILTEFDEIRSTISAEGSAFTGRVSIGMPPTVTELLALPLVEAMRQAHPAATVRIVTGYSLYLLDWVHRGDIDVAILYDPRAIRSLKTEPLLEENFYVVAPWEAGLASDIPFPVADLAGKPLILPSADHSLRQIIDRAAAQAGISLSTAVEGDSYTALKQFVLKDGRWTVLPFAAVQQDVAARRLSAAPLVSPTPMRLLELAVSADRPLTRLASVAQQLIVSVTSRLVKTGQWPFATKRN